MTKKSFIDLVHDFAEARHKHGAAEYNAVTRAAAATAPVAPGAGGGGNADQA